MISLSTTCHKSLSYAKIIEDIFVIRPQNENHSLTLVLIVMYVVMELYYKQTMHVAWWNTLSAECQH